MEFDFTGKKTVTVKTSHPKGIFVAFSPDEEINIGNRVRIHQATFEDVLRLQDGDQEVLRSYFEQNGEYEHIYRMMKWGRLLIDKQSVAPLRQDQTIYEFLPNSLGHGFLTQS